MKTLINKVEESIEIITTAIGNYPKIAVACSFGKDSMVVLHLTRRVQAIPVFTVMTPYKPQETFVYKDMMTQLWGLDIKEYMSKENVPLSLSETNPDECCRILKVEPMKQALKGLDAWITGLRRTEGRTRTNYDFIEKSEVSGIVKINPILDWEEVDIWKYIAMNCIPVHPWYIMGYRSLGCYPCTNIIDDSETERAGRWQGTSKCGGECGIHSPGKM